jgi:hypothetical protein
MPSPFAGEIPASIPDGQTIVMNRQVEKPLETDDRSNPDSTLNLPELPIAAVTITIF